MAAISNYAQLESFGRERLSPNFFMREFLHSEIAWHGLRNVPDHPDVALDVGRKLCQDLLEPLQATFGRIHIRLAYRSPAVNRFGNENGLNCATNEKNYAGHIWDYPDAEGMHGATACIVIPALVDWIESGGSWTAMAWWIHDHLPYSSLCFFATMGAFNISWHQKPARQIDSYAKPKGYLNPAGDEQSWWDARGRIRGAAHVVARAGRGQSEYADSSESGLNRSPSAAAMPRASLVVHGITNSEGEYADVPVNYRAVHTKSAWRIARGHKSIENAIYGKDGAAGLLAGKVRIDYERHGAPLYVFVWQSGCGTGFVVTSSNTSPEGIVVAKIPVSDINGYEKQGGVSTEVLSRLF